MASFFYGKGAQHWANGDVSWGSNTIDVALVATGYSPSANVDEFYSVAVSGGNIVSAGVALASKTNVLGLLNAGNSTWTTVSGSQVTQLVVYVNGTPGSGDYLLLNLNTGTNLPVTPNGGNIVASYDPTNGLGTLMESLSARDRSQLGKFWDWFADQLKSPGGLSIPGPRKPIWEPTTQYIHVPFGGIIEPAIKLG
jgi:hypothetical protein